MNFRRAIVLFLFQCTLLFLWAGLPRAVAEPLRVSGHGTAAVPEAKKKAQVEAAQKALSQAQANALQDGMRQAILKLIIDPNRIAAQLGPMSVAAAEHASTLVSDQTVTKASVDGQQAQAEVSLLVDGKALKDFLCDNFNYNEDALAEDKFRIFVLSYTVEGMDPNHAQPVVLHEEVENDQKNVQAASAAQSSSNLSTSTSSSFLSAHESGASRGAAAASATAYAHAHGAAYSHDGSAAVGATQYASAAMHGNWDNSHSASRSNRQSQASLDANHADSASSSFSDTSSHFHRIVDYADPTKRGSGASNEVRIEMEGMFQSAGFDVATLNLSMMGRAFDTDDDLVNAVLAELRKNAQVRSTDYTAIAMNSFTPVDSVGHRFTSKVTYRVVRVGDGKALMPAQDLPGDSGDGAASDDLARTYAVKIALRKVEDILPGQIKQAMQRTMRSDQRQQQQALLSFDVVIDNPESYGESKPIYDALKKAGFEVKRSSFVKGQAQTLIVTLSGRHGDDVMDALNDVLSGFDVLSADAQAAHLKSK